VLLDLAGVAYKESRVIPGSLAAIGHLRSSKIPGRFMTNTTRLSKNEMLRTLKEIGLSIESDEPFMPIDAARKWLFANSTTPHLLVHSLLRMNFPDHRKVRAKRSWSGTLVPASISEA
jgi:ribonucleotide monophosphatase NagD (HAD superfamily)